MSPLGELLARLRAAFEGIGVRWYLFGAQAAIQHGAARVTADVDVTVILGDLPTQRLVSALTEAGFELRIAGDLDGFLARTRVLPMRDTTTSIPVDVVLGGPGLEEAFADRARATDAAGTRVPVISAEDLVVTKILAGRPKDLEDVVAVLAAQAQALDLEHVRATLRLLEEALGQADLLPAFERSWQRARS